MAELSIKVDDKNKECEIVMNGDSTEVLAMILTAIHAFAEVNGTTDKEMAAFIMDMMEDEKCSDAIQI